MGVGAHPPADGCFVTTLPKKSLVTTCNKKTESDPLVSRDKSFRRGEISISRNQFDRGVMIRSLISKIPGFSISAAATRPG
jgi:hypothetical protein